MSVSDKSGRLLVSREKLCKGWREYLKELAGDDGNKDVAADTMGL